MVCLSRVDLPRFSRGGEVELNVWYWKGGKVVGKEGYGRV